MKKIFVFFIEHLLDQLNRQFLIHLEKAKMRNLHVVCDQSYSPFKLTMQFIQQEDKAHQGKIP